MDEILQLNREYFERETWQSPDLICVEKVIRKIQKHKIVKITWLSFSPKTATVHESVKRMWELWNCFYFNSQIYKNSRIWTAKWILKLVKYASEKKAFDSTSILVFESIEDIKNSKDVISELFQKNKYKIILIGTLKHLHWLPTILIPSWSLHKKINIWKYPHALENYLKLGSLFSFDYSQLWHEQIQIRNMLTDSCVLREIILGYGIKDIFLFHSTLAFLSRHLWEYLSLRDITKLLNEWNLWTSVITMTDYVNNSISGWFLYKIKRYDLKKQKKMDSKWSYYFWDLWILSSIKKDAYTKRYRLIENTLLLELIYNGYEIYTGLNGKFLFSFYTKKLWEHKCIHVSNSIDKKEIKKEINKLAKIHGKSDRFLVVDSLEDLWLRKKDYEGVQLVSFIEMLKILK